jgi:hypothetical protein
MPMKDFCCAGQWPRAPCNIWSNLLKTDTYVLAFTLLEFSLFYPLSYNFIFHSKLA